MIFDLQLWPWPWADTWATWVLHNPLLRWTFQPFWKKSFDKYRIYRADTLMETEGWTDRRRRQSESIIALPPFCGGGIMRTKVWEPFINMVMCIHVYGTSLYRATWTNKLQGAINLIIMSVFQNKSKQKSSFMICKNLFSAILRNL